MFQNPEDLTEYLLDEFRLSPTPHQYKAFHYFAAYYLQKRDRSVYVLRGSAGTGKTTLLTTLTGFLRKQGRPVVLLAPTGRAAKVIGKKTRRSAQTLHRHIYRTERTTAGIFYRRAENTDAQGTVYIVDEASMIGDGEGAGTLLQDLLSFVFLEHPDAILIFSGDDAQLPPVGSDISPALDANWLRDKYFIQVTEVVMSDVKRQALDSGILLNANKIRRVIPMEEPALKLFTDREDIRVLENKSDALEEFSSRFDQDRQDKIIMITFSNYWANLFNKAYRARVFDDIEMPQVNDRIMVVKNNYAWSASEMPFLANGETGLIRKIYHNTYEEKYGLKWVDADIEFENLSGTPIEMYGKIILDLLDSADASIPYETQVKIAQARKKDVILEQAENPNAKHKDPYITALQVKYAYAVTGHKSQGGQWEEVIVAFEPLYPHISMREYLRWAYTAITRAEKLLFLLDCPFIDPEAAEICYRNDFEFNPALLEIPDYFTEAEKKILTELGPQLIRLLNGELPANTEARKHLIRVVNTEEMPSDDTARALLRYIELSEK